jgi:glucosyl-3-phosphoglycerate synthase
MVPNPVARPTIPQLPSPAGPGDPDEAMIRTFHHRDFDAGRLAELKRRSGHVVSVCLPARDEERTVGAIVASLRTDLVEGAGLVDEVLVVDDGSSDGTAEVAEANGARVVQAADVLPELGPGTGKGEALWKSLAAARGDLIAWVDADITDFGPRFVVGLLGPLLTRPELCFVKGFYDRPLQDGAGGGRVTELVARPVAALLFPELTQFVQPLAGEYAGRRTALEQVPFVEGYGVDLALLIDLLALEGPGALAQVDLGTRRHRNRSLEELGAQALAIMQTALRRAGTGLGTEPTTLVRPGLEPTVIDVAERPPLREVAPGSRASA